MENENAAALQAHSLITQVSAFVYAISNIKLDDPTNTAEYDTAMSAVKQIAKIVDIKMVEISRLLGEVEQDFSDLYNAKQEGARWTDRKISEYEYQLAEARRERDDAIRSKNEWRNKAIMANKMDPDLVKKCMKSLNDQAHAAMTDMTELVEEQVQPIVALTLGGQKIDAIKFLRDCFPTYNCDPMAAKSKLDLKTAKEMVESLNLM